MQEVDYLKQSAFTDKQRAELGENMAMKDLAKTKKKYK